MSKLLRESIRKMITQELKSVLKEDTGTVKEVSLSILRVSPDNVKDMAIETAVSMLGIQEKEGYHAYKLNIDGIEFDCSYSPYYQQDENWRGYVDIKIDLKKFDKKVVAAFLKSLKEQFKKNRNESINEVETKNQYTYVHNPKTNKFDVLKVKDGVKVTAFSTEDQASKHVDKINSLGRGYAKIRGKVTEGPEERLGAYRRLVITSTKIPALKSEFTKFTARPEIKADFPVKMTFFDSPKPNVLVVDLNGDNATTLAIKFGDIIKRTDAGAKVLVRTERKLK